jgi:hypothetical protein
MSKFIKNTFLSVFLILVVIVSVFILLKNVIVHYALETAIEKAYSIEISIRDLDVSFTGAHVRMEDVIIYNPPEFKERVAGFLTQVDIRFKPLTYLVRRKWHFDYVGMDIDKMNIIRNKDKTINLKRLDELRKDGSQQEGALDWKEPAKLEIDMFHLKINDVYYIDHTPRGKPKTMYFDLNFDQGFENIDSFKDVGDLVLYTIISKTTIGKLLNLATGPLTQDISNLVMLPGRVATDTIKSIFSLPFIFRKNK